MAGKGDKYRPVDREKYNKNYDRIFRGVEPGIPTATQVDCTTIVKRSDVWPWSLYKVDLTKMDHPTACKYLMGGMKVKVLCRADDHEKRWHNSWEEGMDSYIDKIYTIAHIDILSGIFLCEVSCRFPAFCLQIIEQENNNGCE